ncbi:MAG: hypothetical protein IJ530_11890 [Treponema sp.]|uniref:hypothetical protein n=1 Tax=Treponema sp. TaxID=166 RepID=UPI0025D7CDDD|nr:hypothetical protein [Treponema sp.]MBQ8680445.1 hypothetical protein [Treponema sp.]
MIYNFNPQGIVAPPKAFVGRQADLTEFSTKTREATVGCGEWSAVSAEGRKAK